MATQLTPLMPAAQSSPAAQAGDISKSLYGGQLPYAAAFAANDPNFRPQHSYTQSTLAPTSEFTRYVLLALPARYMFRSVFESLFHSETGYDWMQRPVNKWIDNRWVNKIVSELETVIKQHEIPDKVRTHLDSLKHTGDNIVGYRSPAMIEATQEYLSTDPEGKALQKKLIGILDKNGALGRVAREKSLIPFALTHDDNKITTSGRNILRKAVRGNVGHIGYGLTLGAGALALSLSYSYNVYKDMRHLFSEAVGYELDKDPKQVSITDIFSSNNKIVNATAHNFWWKLAERVGLSVPFFFVARALPLALADFTVGVTGARLLHETWNRKPTMFEDLVSFVNQKINPQNGLGQPIAVADIFDIYQHYCHYNQPDKAFKNVINANNEEGRNWGESQMLFSRIAQLLNHTYAYKHTTQYDNAGNVVKLADFALPKFIYLLGHDLIDAKRPAISLAYVEIANKEGIAGVQKAKEEFAAGATVEQVHAAHGLAPSPIKDLRDSLGTAKAASQSKQAQAANHESLEKQPPVAPKPGVIVEAAQAEHAPLTSQGLQQGL